MRLALQITPPRSAAFFVDRTTVSSATWSFFHHVSKRGDEVSSEMECMCQQCGISTHLPTNQIFLEDPANTEVRLLSDLCLCPKCGGRLFLVGQVGDEPYYRTTQGNGWETKGD